MELDPESCYRAVVSRDRRFDGRFVLAVRTTHVYCRPGCPAPLPKKENSRFYTCATAAEEAGFRPCRRCRPETVAGTPVWSGTSATVSRALRLIGDGTLDEVGVDGLAARLGVGARHLRRLFAEQLGASPLSIARTRRVHFARRLLDDTSLAVTDIAYGAGFASIRTFNEAMVATFHRSPSALRSARARGGKEATLTLKLPFRPPLDWPALVGFLSLRAIPGVERVTADRYARTIADGEESGVLEAWPMKDAPFLSLRLPLFRSGNLISLVERASRLFDLEADPIPIQRSLGEDSLLAPLVKRRPGLRVPGAWDPFELLVRAVLGQQISVKGATTLAGRLVSRFGRALPEGAAELTHLFPTAAALAEADLTSVGLTRSRAATLKALAGAVATRELSLTTAATLEEFVARLTAIPGIGPWTAHYVAMRALKEPDAFPEGDLALRQAAVPGETPLSIRALAERAEAWRPWRAYAALHLWTSLSDANRKDLP
ncbi:MAG: AlkA N-terminal domain-containing protein [Thermoanaerobaculia bacterium]